MKLHHQIFLAMVLGGLAGAATSESTRLLGLPLLPAYDLIGELFINALKMVVVPLITTAIISGMINVGEDDNLGRLGAKTVVFYLATSLIAILVGLVVVNLIVPGVIDGEPAKDLLGLAKETDQALQSIEGRGAADFTEILRQLLPPNLFQAAAETQMLGLIVFSLFFGYFLRTLRGAPGEHLRQTVEGIYQVVLRITMVIIRFAPLGVFGLIAATVTRTGLDAVEPLALFFITVLLALALHMFVVMPLLIRFLAKRSPWRHLQAMTPALLTAFSSASSAATLPLSMECVEKRSGVSNRTASFVLPLGATVNMDGTALYECVAAIFIAQAYGLDLSLTTQFVIVLTALLTSIGVASIPAASLVAITVILGVIGLPAEAIGLILVTDRLLDMCRTAVNVWGDSVGAVLLARSEGEEDVLRRPMRELDADPL
ncbi:sodium:dicarboxylate symporter family protein [Alcanivorax sp. 521-1]|uniref:Sodium:dicarboxylate symporter family protein n=1 Tax=Alloalcanivorax profundimaris TaxID=2735259 RepID=A0ABS0AU91_9GAMM|nr:dicarboxylate/amino acid:cation symporter [Alloalcanivorax profundimaris]MAO60657.1 dicarboxylate/amino acid:cation symporter [Alcanivorax sp.]MBM1145021.1 dicarboxylate/amino acid:cation symporter [Alcanivorax sp. ZXX171]MAY10414.1 dicarboxylate/amino acid:cation symporter [Alcanivorax sp.]MBF5057683.1 sodium:dicarboxylate symporter family protein [Alloalcanivorax profundimaris]HCE40486.1 dicarboxylate/amino acid:cation symporter [Alcanivorax sp.]|tara:strand:- start:11585 stop:12874 length:1290 start_codon:yes stop_codon:yes gene_type:complete